MNIKAPRLWADLPKGATVMVDTAPFIYVLESHPQFAAQFLGLFEAAAQGDLTIALSTITLAEILTGPFKAGQTALAKRYEKSLGHYTVVPVSTPIATLAAQLRAQYRLKLPDAIQLATSLDIGAAAFVTHDRDFSAVTGVTILRGDTVAAPKRPIGVFDSGVGGLSVLKALRAELPFEDFVYVSDSGHAPYGERDDAFVIERANLITQHLLAQHPIKALVMACNTATAATIHLLRAQHPTLPIIGVEPALKPALALSKTRRIGVMATRGTLGSAKFQALLASLADQADFVCQPCDGLADAIERQDAPKIIAGIARYTGLMGQFGLNIGEIDTLVLGCTHYPFATQTLQDVLGPQIQLIDNGEPVARQTRRVLPELSAPGALGQCRLLCTGDTPALQQAAQRWLQLDGQAETVHI